MLRRRAAALLAQLQSGDPDAARKLKNWCNVDPMHAQAFERVRRSYEKAGLLRHSAIIESLQYEPEAQTSRWQQRAALAASAAVIVLVPVGVLLVRGGAPPFGGTEAVMLMTSVGEIRQFDLADGSKVTLDTATKVAVEVGRSHRRAHLEYGRARFRVVKADAPFTVETASATVTTRGGVVDVEQVGSQGRIQVIAGQANVTGSNQHQAPSRAIEGGQGVTVKSEMPEQKNGVTPGPDWTRGMLQFEGTPLADAVALANRYSERHIIVAGDLNALRVTGAFRAADTYGLAKALAAAFHLSLRSTADGNLVLSLKDASAGRQ